MHAAEYRVVLFKKASAIIPMLRLALTASALFYVVLYIIIALVRLRHPFALDWLEEAMLDQVRRVVEGQALYAKPSLEYVPFFYTPLFFYVVAVVTKVFGLNFFSLHLVSVLASFGCLCMIFLFVKKETNSAFAGIVAMGLFAATYRISADWFDFGRVDSLFLFLLLVSVYLLRFGIGWRSQVAAGVFAVLSFLTKQTALLVFVPLILASIALHKRKSFVFIGTLVALTSVSFLLLNSTSDGWFAYYFLLATKHPFAQPPHDLPSLYLLFSFLPVAWIALVYYLYKRISEQRKDTGFFYLFVALGMITASVVSRLHSGGYLNAFIPAYALLAIFVGLATARLPASIMPEQKGKLLIIMCVYLFLLWQFAHLFYDTKNLIPSEDDRAIGEQTLALIASIPGEVFVPTHNFLPSLVGKKTHANIVAVWDIFRAEDHQVAKQLKRELVDAIRQQKFSAIIFDNAPTDLPGVWLDFMDAFYVKNSTLFVNETGYITMSSARVRPASIFVPRQLASKAQQ